MNFSFQSLPNRSGFPRLILTFANSLDPETCKVRRSFWALSGSKLFDTLMLFPKRYFDKSNTEYDKNLGKFTQYAKSLPQHLFWTPTTRAFEIS